ncbi:carbohydrate porin [Telmatospirillum sp.]|uniref:carbohydrate porin n=1 Tax=Telmatospirillum sp. TaxID=2079197 RepID=UPI002850CB19|nr:carbohydrate porin [Telmatospirillum sp.]MDR3438296.1 carbohydrate porin [Telmatospirillum sp.]
MRPIAFKLLNNILFVPATCFAISLLGNSVNAAAPSLPASPDSDASQSSPMQGGDSALGFLDGISRSSLMLGDMWGLRPWLSQYGVTFSALETSEVLGNVSGGNHKGFDYDGLTTATLQMDTERAFGWHGGTFNVSGLQIHGRNLSSDNLSSLQTASGIESDRSTRLWELWYQQKFLEDDRLDVKVGQQSLDQEFMVSQNALLFVNTMFGWPMLPSADMPGGGPAYPLSALGIRGRYHVTDSTTVLAGLYNGNPLKSGTDDNKSGTSFAMNGNILGIAELQYSYPSLNTMVMAGEAEPLARTYKLGFWYNNERFDDLAIDDTGLSLADPDSSGTPRTHRGNYAIYAVADQMVWRSFDEPDRTINLFARVMGTPDEDRNLIDFSANAGVTVHEPILGRDDDTFGLGIGYTQVSGHARLLDQNTGTFSGSYYPVRGSETFVEVTYQYALTPWWQMQPDFQYVFNPGAGALNSRGAEKIGDEAVIGVRTNIAF